MTNELFKQTQPLELMPLRGGLLRTSSQNKQNGQKHEFQKPGRFANFYKQGRIPMFFRSLHEEKAMGSTQGDFLTDWANKKGVSVSALNKNIPQICLIPKNQIADYLKARFEKDISTPQKRQAIDMACSKSFSAKENALDAIRSNLIAIDWAEQTHHIQINIDQEILDWLKRYSC
ncbi:MAG: hypothetical protein WC915_05855 [archaeon]|jgi:hypothetical protein